MEKGCKTVWLMAGLLAAVSFAGPACASAAGEMGHGKLKHGEMDHGKMKHGEMDHGKMKHGEMDHGKMKHGKTVTVEGEIVDMACYMGHGAKGKKHRKCAKSCLLGGTPAGILTEGGDLYLIVDSHGKKSKKAYQKVLELAAAKVKLTGKKYVKQGVAAIAVEKVRKIK